MMLLKNCRLVPELTGGYDGVFADILLSNGKIEGIFPPGFIAENTEVLDMGNRTVLPGLFDLHLHIDVTSSDYSAVARKDNNEDMLDGITHMQKRLEYGYTTLRSCGCLYNVEIALRDAVRAGLLTGPNLMVCGPIFSPTAKGNAFFSKLYVEVDSPGDYMREVRKVIAAGADFVKITATGSVLNPGGVPGQQIMTGEEIRAAVEAAAFNHTYAAAHCHGKEAIIACMRAGVATIEHATFLDDECVQIYREAGCTSAVVPTLAVNYPGYLAARDIRDEGRSHLLQKSVDTFEMGIKSARLAYDAGIPLGWGTDNPLSEFLEQPAREFICRRMAGFTNVQLLKQATIDSARIADMDKEYGTIERGKVADLAVVDGNPDEDIEVMDRKPHAVFKAGKPVRIG